MYRNNNFFLSLTVLWSNDVMDYMFVFPPPPNLYVKTLTPKGMVLGGGALDVIRFR